MNLPRNYTQIRIKPIHILTPYLFKAYFNILIPPIVIPGKLPQHTNRYTLYSYTSGFWHLGGSCVRISPLDYVYEENENTCLQFVCVWHSQFLVQLGQCAVGGVRHPQQTQTSSNSSTIAADSSNGVINTRCCRYSCMRSWWWVEVPPETCRAVSRYK